MSARAPFDSRGAPPASDEADSPAAPANAPAATAPAATPPTSPPKLHTPDSFEVERTTGSHEILDRLFVYGTLRVGQTARSLVANSIQRCMPARASGQLYAFPMGYPGFIEGAGAVLGEVCWLEDLAATFSLLDAYEGEDFTRVIRRVTLQDGRAIWSWIYLLTDARAATLGELIADGDWVRHWNAQLE